MTRLRGALQRPELAVSRETIAQDDTTGDDFEDYSEEDGS